MLDQDIDKVLRNLRYAVKGKTYCQRRKFVKKLKRRINRRLPYSPQYTMKDALQDTVSQYESYTLFNDASKCSFSCGHLLNELLKSRFEHSQNKDLTVGIRGKELLQKNEIHDCDSVVKESSDLDSNKLSTVMTLEHNVEIDESNSHLSSSEKNNQLQTLLNQIDIEVKEWHNPYINVDESPPKSKNHQSDDINNTNLVQLKPICQFYSKFGVCKFGYFCNKRHEEVIESDCIIIPSMFSSFSIDIKQKAKSAGGSHGDVFDVSLEYSFSDLYDDYLVFFNDVIPELKKFGRLTQFRVCYNLTNHFCGNTYVQYSSIHDAKSAMTNLIGRYFGGKVLHPRFVAMKNWNNVICTNHYRYRNCERGQFCNYLHVFSNPPGQLNFDKDLSKLNSSSPLRYSSRTSLEGPTNPCQIKSTDKHGDKHTTKACRDSHLQHSVKIMKCRNETRKMKKKSRKDYNQDSNTYEKSSPCRKVRRKKDSRKKKKHCD